MGVVAMKTFVTQVLMMLLLAIYLVRLRGTLLVERASEVLTDLRGLPGGGEQILDEAPYMKEVASEFGHGSAFFIGCKLGASAAIEGR